jgi:ABC-2 type transport system permease protein
MGLRGGEPNWMTSHYLTVALGYEVMLLAEVMIWNVFGFDRRAAQVYFAFPVKTSTVLVAKNLSALFFVLLDAALIIVICVLLGFRLTWESLGEALSVLVVLTLMLVAIGNLVSVRNPRPVDPDHSWGRSSAGRMQAILLLVYPVVFGPIALAFLARSAFEVEWAFYSVLAFDLVLGAILYWVSFDSALEHARKRQEEILASLSREQGLLSN